ncbi:RDD family protein [Chryseobacterium paridis]|uniref:RDD family protein n=1 Tax=Chryseobacterium paridis TaxID=2800328 RepID=A0ABS1FX90_9FLAO|nr:RDD family protein [Chryseobacterium paridis]MBK1897005.1 RDD family protein [Chryseobacterium paridis]
MKISEIKERKVIHRPTRYFDESGQRIYHAYEYHLPYNPGYKGNETERLFAKVIDMLPFFLIFHFIFHKMILISILLSIPCVLILGAITEFYWGNTLGKKTFKIKVVDDNGNYPGFLKSIQRNLLCLANLYPTFTDFIPIPNYLRRGSRKSFIHFSMYINNTICKTYIVKESKISEIEELLKHQENQNLLS